MTDKKQILGTPKVFLVKISDKEQERDLLYGDIVDEVKELTPSDLEQIRTALSILINGVLPSLSGVLSQGEEKDANLLKKLSEVNE